MRLAHISLAFAGLMWVLPFLYYHHALPLPAFYQEWGAAMLGLCAMPLLVTQRFWQQPKIPRIVLLPAGLTLLVLVQFALGRVAYFDQALLFALYMLWVALLIMLGHRLREELGLPALATALAVFLLLGAELNALVGVLQHYRWHIFLDAVIMAKVSVAVYGNMGQPNDFANYVTLGLVSLGLLHTRWRLRAWQVVLLAAPLLFVLTLSGSRSTWLYLLCMVGMAFLWSRRNKSNQTLLYYSLLLLIGFVLMHLVVQIPWLAGSSGSITSAQRLFFDEGANDSNSIRLRLWREAWLIFTQFPWLGAGFGQFAWQHFQIGPVSHNNFGPEWQAHNIIMQIAAEMGLAGLLILFSTLALWFWQARSEQRTPYHWWGCALLVMLAIHSLLEFPLWFAYFLGVAALTLGMLDTTTCRLELRGMGRLSVAAMLLLGLLSLSQMLYIYGYHDLEGGTDTFRASKTDASYAQHIRTQRLYDDMAAIQGRALLLRPYVERLLGDSGWDHVADNRALNGRVMHSVPTSLVVYREALLLARAGQQAKACAQIERAIWIYPSDFPVVHGQLRTLADMDTNPARFSALLECALQKYEERERLIHATH